MTPELQQRLEQSDAPFDGLCIHNADVLSLSQLRRLLEYVFPNLESRDSTIRRYRDWHEHDGYVVESIPTDWDFLKNALLNDRTLYDSRDEDFAVRIAVYSQSFDWLLRYNVDDEDESDYNTAACDFDLSVALNAGLDELLDSLLAQFPQLMRSCPARPWFSSTYGG